MRVAATVHAGAGTILAGAVFGSSAKGANAAGACRNSTLQPNVSHGASCIYALQPESDSGACCGDAVQTNACTTSNSQPTKSSVRKFASKARKQLKNPGVFQKAFKCFAALATVTNPLSTRQEFLIDWGASRNLISRANLSEDWMPFLDDAPEKFKFATGGGVRTSSQAIRLRGDQSREGMFYALPECPAALSLGQQVNEHVSESVAFLHKA